MANPTTNFNWQMPTSSDLVTDLPADFEVFGQAVDTALADLKGGTTGQVLKKNTNTDMDFVWSADSAGMTNPMTTTGDIIYSSSGSTPARLGIGTTGQVLNVSGGVPAWSTVSSGGMTVLASGSLSGSSVSLTSISADYKNLQLVVRNFQPAGNDFALKMRLNNDSTSKYNQGSAFDGAISPGSTLINFTDQKNSASIGAITVDFYDYANSSNYKIGSALSLSERPTANTFAYDQRPWFYFVTGAINRIDLLVSGTTMSSGTYVLYGVK